MDEGGFYNTGWQPAVIGGKGDDEGRVIVLVDQNQRGEVNLSKGAAVRLAWELLVQVIKETVGWS